MEKCDFLVFTAVTYNKVAFFYVCVCVYIYIYIYQLCMLLKENVKLQFIQKDIFLFKISYISVFSKKKNIYNIYRHVYKLIDCIILDNATCQDLLNYSFLVNDG